MNDIDKKRIIEMKKAGNGYGVIAKELCLSKSTVSSFLKSLEDVSICKCCGKKFTQPKGVKQKIFCSDKCRFKYRRLQNKGNPIESGFEVECLCCHKTFNSYKSLKRKFCSRKCYNNFRSDGVNNESTRNQLS